MKFKVALCDIEGTTTSISFVHEVLFPIAYDEMPAFLENHYSDGLIKSEIKNIVSSGVGDSPADVCAYLQGLIKEDKKDTDLKSIQGKIWAEAYSAGKIKGHLYEDVLPAWRLMKEQGRVIAIYSSGSVEAQKLIFGFSEKGDLTEYISAYFDTRVGGKKESASYHTIVKELQVEAADILFLSDVGEELDAAAEAGLQTMQFKRSDNQKFIQSSHETVTSFDGIPL